MVVVSIMLVPPYGLVAIIVIVVVLDQICLRRMVVALPLLVFQDQAVASPHFPESFQYILKLAGRRL